MQKGVQYVQHPLGFPNERRSNKEPLMLVYDGSDPCMREWNIDGTPPPGFVKKVQRVCGFSMPRLQDNSREFRAIEKVIDDFNKLPGITAMFARLGTKSKDIGAFSHELDWWDLPQYCQGMTHGFFLVADGVKEFKGWLHGKAHKREWAKVTEGLIENQIVSDCQLGMDLVKPTSQKDPIIFNAFLRCRTGEEGLQIGEGELWHHLGAVLHSMNTEVPGVKCTIQQAGFGGYSWQEWLDEVWCPDQSFGCTFVFTLVANNPLCFKRWKHSEQFHNMFSEILPHAFIHEGMSPACFAAMPMDITTKL